MLFFIGFAVLIGAILGGYLPHGKIEVLWQPLEFVIIVGSALGGFIIANPRQVIFGVIKSLGHTLKGPRHSKSS